MKVRTLTVAWSAEASRPDSVVVVDAHGEVFERLRLLTPAVPVWRVLDLLRIPTGLAIDRIVYAVYGRIDWTALARLSSHGPTLIISTTYRRSEAEEALREGLLGYLDAALPQPAYERAVRGTLLHDEPGYSRDVIGARIRELRTSSGAEDERMSGLTPRQKEIVTLIAEGKTDKEIAAALGIAHTTAQKHISKMLRRLRVPNRAAAVAAVHLEGAQVSRVPESFTAAAQRVADRRLTAVPTSARSDDARGKRVS